MSDESLHEHIIEIGDFEIDVNSIEELIGANISVIVPLDGGSINRVVRLDLADGDPLIVRIAPGRDEAEFAPSWLTHRGLEREQDAIQRLSRVKSIKKLLPTTIHYEWSLSYEVGDMVIQTLVPGQPAAAVLQTMTEDQRLDFYRQLGEMTREIHSVRGNGFGPSWDDELFDTWTELVLSDCEGFLEDAEILELQIAPFEALVELVEANRAELDSVPGVLIHSDLSMEHVFVEQKAKQWKISGLIDLEFARFADPVSEGLVLEMLQRSDAESEAFFDGYGRDLVVSDLRIDVARRLQAAWEMTDKARIAGQ